MINNVCRSDGSSCYCCQTLVEPELFPQIVEEYWNIQFNENPFSGSADGQTDRLDEANSRFSQSCEKRLNFSVQPTQCICVFCVDLRRNSDYFTVQH
jgi:hypothetical protein